MEKENRKLIAFRLDGGSRNSADPGNRRGVGHISRGLSIAEQCVIRGGRVFFIMRDYPAGTSLVKEKYPVVTIPGHFDIEQEKSFLLDVLKARKPAVLLLDILNSEKGFIEESRKSGPKIVSIDDERAHPEVADAVIFSLLRPQEQFRSFRNYYSGPQYQIIKPGYFNYRGQNKIIPPQARKILVSLGGSDPTNSVFKVAAALEEVEAVMEVTIILGPAFAAPQELRAFRQGLRKEFLVKDWVVEMEKEVFSADLMIGSGGVTVWEAAFLGTPSMVLCHNHHELNNAFNDYDFVVNLGLAEQVRKEDIKKSVTNLINNQGLRNDLSKKGRELIDGLGAARVAEVIVGLGGSKKASKTRY